MTELVLDALAAILVVLLLFCASALTSCGQVIGSPEREAMDITDRMVWVTRTYDCEADKMQVGTDSRDVGYSWPELAADRVRAAYIVRAPLDGAREATAGVVQFRDGLVRYEPSCTPDELLVVTLGLEMPNAK
jgi:hypothetical protein